MSFCFNRITLGGYLTRDPELRQAGDDHRVAQLSLAVNASPRRDASGDPLYIEIEAWDKQADLVMQYLHKGSPLLVDGMLQLNRWQDRDGNNRSRHLVRASQIRLIPRGSSQDSSDLDHQDAPDRYAAPVGYADNDDADPPF